MREKESAAFTDSSAQKERLKPENPWALKALKVNSQRSNKQNKNLPSVSMGVKRVKCKKTTN